ncbi:MAG: hypothetical protein V7695_20550 [Sulfitobacter sp.]
MEKLELQSHRHNLDKIVDMPNPHETAKAFTDDFGAMEYALKRSDFLRKNKDVAEADWDLFAQSLGVAFFEHVVGQGIATTLISAPPQRLMANLKWTPQTKEPLANVAQLIINGVCRVRNSYLHGEKFTGGPDGQWKRDVVLVAEAHAVLKSATEFASNTLAKAYD